MSEANVSKEVLTVDEAAAVLRINRNTAYKAVRKGTIPSLRFGDRIVVPRAKLSALLNGNASAG